MNRKTDLSAYLKETCQEHNLKLTPQRIQIYNELFDDKSHPSADNIYHRVKRKLPAISFDTVNRTLISFAEIGLLNIIEGNGSPKRYDPGLHNHHHFQCLSCNKIIDFEDTVLDKIKVPKKIAKENKIINHRLVINGICKDCLK